MANRLVDYLTERYPGATALRALWLWSGGAPRDVEVEGDARSLWERQWARAIAGDGERGVALVREALRDEPGHPLLLDELAALRLDGAPKAEVVAETLVELEKVVASDVTPAWLGEALELLVVPGWA